MGDVVAAPTADAVFGFHHVNAFERDGGTKIVFDLETVPDAPGIGDLYLDSVREGNLDAIAGRLERFTIDLGRPTDPGRYDVEAASVSREMLYDDRTALPTASPARWCQPHCYVYAMSMAHPATDLAHGVLKIDTESGTVTEQSVGGDYFGEPIFVPDDGPAEDGGVVLSISLDEDAGRSRLLVLDGETLSELAGGHTSARGAVRFPWPVLPRVAGQAQALARAFRRGAASLAPWWLLLLQNDRVE